MLTKEVDVNEDAQDGSGANADDSPPGSKKTSLQRGYMVGRVALRTVFFDTKLLDAVTSGPPAAIKQVTLLALQQRKNKSFAQVLRSAIHGTAAGICGRGATSVSM